MMRAKVVVVTGASAGIGRATALAFARRGWRIGLLARGLEGLRRTEEEVVGAGGQALVVQVDVANAEEVEAAAGQVESGLGPIDVWVNNAMATIFCPFSEITPEDFRRATEVTYLGAVWGTRAALTRMRARNRGTIVQVGSALAYRSIPLQAPYCGAKSALRGFTDSLRSELIHDRSAVHLTMVHLSAFNTPQFDWAKNCLGKRATPLGRIFQPEVAAEAIYRAAQMKRRELWVGWPAAQAILATRVIPALLDYYLGFRAYEGQHTTEPLPATYRDNLYSPVPAAGGAHGRFDHVAKTRSWQLWFNLHRPWLAVGAVGLMIVAGILLAQ